MSQAHRDGSERCGNREDFCRAQQTANFKHDGWTQIVGFGKGTAEEICVCPINLNC